MTLSAMNYLLSIIITVEKFHKNLFTDYNQLLVLTVFTMYYATSFKYSQNSKY